MAKIINGSSLYLALANYLASNAYLNDTAKDVLAMVCVWIDEAKAIQVPKWIPVTERLPQKATDYLCRCVVNDDNTYPFYMVLRYILFDENPHFQHETKGGMKVTHWMPLPEPPKEVGNG